MRKLKGHDEVQTGLLAVSKDGVIGAYSLRKGFNYALYADQKNSLIDSEFLIS